MMGCLLHHVGGHVSDEETYFPLQKVTWIRAFGIPVGTCQTSYVMLEGVHYVGYPVGTC